MRAITTTPAAIIEQIKVNLHDRYFSGFPILKELVQNADDARATRLDVGWLPNAGGNTDDLHPLLRGPGVFVLNDGLFTAEDGEKIALMGMGSKGGRPASIGKFGLGLKSVFHLCEAFFYVAHALHDEPPERVRKEFVNPWAEMTLHPEWKRDISDLDVAVLRRSLGALIPASGPWFFLWLPLRTRAQLRGTAPLIAAYPGEPLSADSPGGFAGDAGDCIFFSECDDNLATLMPMLKSVRQVCGWRPAADAASDAGAVPLQRKFSVAVIAGSKTTVVGAKTAPFEHRVEGKVVLDRSPLPPVPEAAGTVQPAPAAAASQVVFSGTERWLDSPAAAELQSSGAWPQRVWTDPETGEDRHDKEKAIPHVAAYFVLRKVASGAAKLKIMPAVFLPLGEAAGADHATRRFAYQLVLHGYFFVDAGRKGIDFGDRATDSVEQPEQKLRRDWNRLLRDDGLLPLVIPALDRLAAALGRTHAALDDLTAALEAIKNVGGDRAGGQTFLDAHRSHLCNRVQWVKRLNADGSAWGTLNTGGPLYTVPSPDRDGVADGPSLLYRVFPGLSALQPGIAVTAAGSPRLCLNAPVPLPPDVLVRLLAGGPAGFDAPAAFADGAAATYFVDTVGHTLGGHARSAELEDALVRVTRAACRTVDTASDGPLVPTLTRLVAHTPADRRLPLRSRGRLPDEILAFDATVLVIPERVDTRRPAFCPRLSTRDAVGLLGSLAALGGRSADGSATPVPRSDLACQIVEACEPKSVRPEVLASAAQLRLFDGLDLSQNRAGTFALQELEVARGRGLLFARTERSEQLARLLQAALADHSVLLVGPGVGRLLAGGVGDCDAAACLAAVGRARRLAGTAARADLLRALLPAEQAWRRDAAAAGALRFLLHGRSESLAAADGTRLFAPTAAGAWGTLLRKLLGLRAEDWRVIDPELAHRLSPDQAAALGIDAVAAASVGAYAASVAAVPGAGPAALSTLDCSDLADEEADALAFEFPLTPVGPHTGEQMRRALRALPLHRTTRGTRAPVGDDGYLDDPDRGFDLDDGLLSGLTVFVVHPDPVRAAKQGEVFGPGRRLTPGTVLTLAAREGGPPVHWRTVLHALSKAGEHPALDDLRLKPWLDVFADADVDPRRWLGVLDRYLDPAIRDAKYYRGMQRFISFYQFARHLPDYAQSFLDVNAMGANFTLGQVLRSRENPFQSGGGVDVPPLTNALGVGACFVMRELVRAGLVTNSAAHRYCYVPVRRVRLLLAGLGCDGVLDNETDRWERSRRIHAFLSAHMPAGGANGHDPTFGGDFDLPLLAAAEGELGQYGLPDDTEAFMRRGMEDLAD